MTRASDNSRFKSLSRRIAACLQLRTKKARTPPFSKNQRLHLHAANELLIDQTRGITGAGRRLACGILASTFALLIFIALPSTAEAACLLPNQITNGQPADATAVMDNFNAVKDCADQAVTSSDSPVTGSIAVFSGSRTIADGNLTGDCTTSGDLVVTCTRTNGTSLGYFATGTDAAQLSGNIPVSRLNNGIDADSTHFWRGDGVWAVPPSGTNGGGGGANRSASIANNKSTTSSDGHYVPNQGSTPSTSASSADNLKVSFTPSTASVTLIFTAIYSRSAGLSRFKIQDVSGNDVWPKYPQSPDPSDPAHDHTKFFGRLQGESGGKGHMVSISTEIPVTSGTTHNWVIKVEHANSVGSVTYYDRSIVILH